MSRFKLSVSAAATLALAVAVAPQAAGQGETVTVATEVKLRNAAPAFHGRVKADDENCVEQRKVKMFKLKRSGVKRLIGTDEADNEGKWEVLYDKVGSGGYFAVAPRVTQGTAGTIYECERGKSRTLVVD